MKIFTEIFKRSPEAKALFPFRNAKPEDLPNDVTFRGHSSRYDTFVIFWKTFIQCRKLSYSHDYACFFLN